MGVDVAWCGRVCCRRVVALRAHGSLPSTASRPAVRERSTSEVVGELPPDGQLRGVGDGIVGAATARQDPHGCRPHCPGLPAEVFLVERVVTAWSEGRAGRLLALPVVVELAYAAFLQVTFVTGLVQIVLRREAGWTYVRREVAA